MTGSVWFQPEIFEQYQVKAAKATHSTGCRASGGNEEGLFLEMDFVAQDAILACGHSSHDSVKFIFKHFHDGPTSDKIEEGKIF